MTTQFTQRVPFTFLLRFSSNNSYFILCPRIPSVINKCLSFGGYPSFSDVDSVLPHYSPSYPVDFSQFGQAWCEESLRAYFNRLNIGSYINSVQFEGIRYNINGNNLNASGLYSSIIICNLLLNNQIDTDFDNLFSDLITQISSSAVSIATQIADSNTNLLSVITNLTNLNNNLGNINTSLNNLNIDIGDVDIQTDNLVTQLQNIYTILASQNANQSAISSAISNKDNQSSIVQNLQDIFTYKIDNNKRRNIFTGLATDYVSANNTAFYRSLAGALQIIRQCFLTDSPTPDTVSNLNTKLFANLITLNNAGGNNVASYRTNSYLKEISDKLQIIETKLEQNLPFTTNVDNVLVIDGQQDFKIRNKNDDEVFD